MLPELLNTHPRWTPSGLITVEETLHTLQLKSGRLPTDERLFLLGLALL